MLKYRWLLDESRNLAQTIVELKYVQCSDAGHLLKKYEKVNYTEYSRMVFSYERKMVQHGTAK